MAKCCVHFLERWCRACDEIIFLRFAHFHYAVFVTPLK